VAQKQAEEIAKRAIVEPKEPEATPLPAPAQQEKPTENKAADRHEAEIVNHAHTEAVVAEKEVAESASIEPAPIPVVEIDEVERQIIEQRPLAEAVDDPELTHVADVPAEAVKNYDEAVDRPVADQEIALIVSATGEASDEEESDDADLSLADSEDHPTEDQLTVETDTSDEPTDTGSLDELAVDLANDTIPVSGSDEEDLVTPTELESDNADAELSETDEPGVILVASTEAESEPITEISPEVPPMVWKTEADGQAEEVPAVIAEPLTRLTEATPKFETETAHEVHQALKEVEATIEDIIGSIEVETGTEDADTEITEEQIEQLTEAILQLYAAAGIAHEPEDIKRMVRALTSRAESDESIEDVEDGDEYAERGTLEKLQWFQSLVKSLKWQTNPVHLFLGKFALTSVRELQAA
jgi:hypothetical protein